MRRIVREQECEGIDGGRQIIGVIARVLGVAERQLGESEQGVWIKLSRRDRAVQADDRSLRVALEPLRQILAVQDDLGGLADVAGRDYVAGQLTLHDARVGAVDLYRCRAGGEQQQQSHRGAKRRAPPHVLAAINPLGLPARPISLHYPTTPRLKWGLAAVIT